MDYKMSYRIKLIFLWTAIVLLVLFLLTGMALIWLVVVAGVLAICGIMQAAIFFTCPHCGAHWDFRGKIPKHCPECGHKVDER